MSIIYQQNHWRAVLPLRIIAPLFTTAALILPTSAYAQDYCDTLDLQALNAECAEISIAQALVNLPGLPAEGKDALVFDATKLPILTVQQDTDFRVATYRPWQSVFIGSTASSPAHFEIRGTRPSNVVEPLSLRLAVQNLTLDNAIVTTPFTSAPLPGQQPGQVTEFIIGDTAHPGVLSLRNASFLPDANTNVIFGGSPDTPARIEVLGGDNVLNVPNSSATVNGVHLDIAAGTNLTFGGNIAADERSFLTMASGSTLTVRDGTLRLVQTVGDANPTRSNIDGARIIVSREGGGGALQLGDTAFNNVTLDIADTLQVYNSQILNAGFGTASFTGDNTVNLSADQSLFSTSQDPLRSQDQGTIWVQSGTTRFSGSGQINVGTFRVDSGILDVSGMEFGALFRQQRLRNLLLSNGGLFIDGSESEYLDLQFLQVDDSTLRIAQSLGSYDRNAGVASFRFNDAVIVPNFDQDPTRVGRRITFNAATVEFAGANTIELAFDPNGQCAIALPGACPQALLLFNDTVNFNVGNSPLASFFGFGTVTFLPVANALYAPSDYINGGNNGIYTISRVNTDPNLVDITLPDGTRITPQTYDALPNIPTLNELAQSGSNLPANLSYVIVNDPLQDEQIDIAFVERNLGNHPDLAAEYSRGETTRIVTEPETGNITTITISITPDTDGTAQETTSVIVTEPGGNVISTSSVTVGLDRPTGTMNTQNAGNLLSQAAQIGTALPHIAHQNIATQLTSFHPEPYSSFLTVGLEQLDLFRNMALDHASGGGFSANAREDRSSARRRLWLDSAYVDGHVDGENNLGSFGYDLYNIAIGADIVSRPDARIGVFAGYGHQTMNEHDLADQDFSADSYHIGGYGQYHSGDWDTRAVAAYALGNNDAVRETALGTVASTNRAQFDSHSFYAGVRLQYHGLVQSDAIAISPEVGFGYSHLRQNSLTESGDPATALQLERATAESVITSAGLNFALMPNKPIHPVGFVRYERDWYADRNAAHTVHARLASTPDQQTQGFIGQNRGADAVTAGIGLVTNPSSSVRIGGGVIYTKTDNGEEWGGGLNISIAL